MYIRLQSIKMTELNDARRMLSDTINNLHEKEIAYARLTLKYKALKRKTLIKAKSSDNISKQKLQNEIATILADFNIESPGEVTQAILNLINK